MEYRTYYPGSSTEATTADVTDVVQVAGHGDLVVSPTGGPAVVRKPTTWDEVAMYLRLNLPPSQEATTMSSTTTTTTTSSTPGDVDRKRHHHIAELRSYFPQPKKILALLPRSGDGDEEEEEEVDIPWEGPQPHFTSAAEIVDFLHHHQRGTSTGKGIDISKITFLLEMENLCFGCRYPCVLDIKVGEVRWTPTTSHEKVSKIREKEGPTSSPVVNKLRICGVQQYVPRHTTTTTTGTTTTTPRSSHSTEVHDATSEQQDRGPSCPQQQHVAGYDCWVAGKDYGRMMDRNALKAAIGGFVGLVADSDERRNDASRSTGVTPTCSSGKRNAAAIERLERFHSQVSGFHEALQRTGTMQDYSFTSSSFLLVYDAAAVVADTNVTSHHQHCDSSTVQCRLLDLARSGPLTPDEWCPYPTVDDVDVDAPSPTAPTAEASAATEPPPECSEGRGRGGKGKYYPDDVVKFLEGVSTLSTLLSELIAENRIP